MSKPTVFCDMSSLTAFDYIYSFLVVAFIGLVCYIAGLKDGAKK